MDHRPPLVPKLTFMPSFRGHVLEAVDCNDAERLLLVLQNLDLLLCSFCQYDEQRKIARELTERDVAGVLFEVLLRCQDYEVFTDPCRRWHEVQCTVLESFVTIIRFDSLVCEHMANNLDLIPCLLRVFSDKSDGPHPQRCSQHATRRPALVQSVTTSSHRTWRSSRNY